MLSTQQQIHAQMTISDILSMFPQRSQQLAQIITKAGLHCVGCGAAVWETLEGGMIGHGKSEEETVALVKDLNALLERPLDLETVTLTSKAAQKFLEIAQEDGKQGWSLRLGDKAAGCSGFEYVLDFCEKPSEDDLIFEQNDIQVVVNKYSAPRLMGSEIDYVEGLYGAGFKISNPQSKSSCGCGNSHNY